MSDGPSAFLAPPGALFACHRHSGNVSRCVPKRRARKAYTQMSLQWFPELTWSRVTTGIAGAALVVTLSNTSGDVRHLNPNFPRPPQAAAQTTTEVSSDDLPDMKDPSSLTSEQRKILKEQSRRNTRAAGKVSQKFSSARRASEAGDLDTALAAYNEIIALSPDFAPAYSNRGNIFVARKQLDAALKDYDRCVQLAPLDGDSWVVFVNRGATKLAMGDTTGALADMNTAYGLKGDSEIVLSNRAGVYEVLGKWDNAIRDYQAALKSNDVRPFWERYGLVLFQRNKGFEALSILKRVAARFDVGDVHAALAVIYFDRGDVAAAETEWSRVDRPKLFESKQFLETERKWPPRAIEAMDNFRQLKE